MLDGRRIEPTPQETALRATLADSGISVRTGDLCVDPHDLERGAFSGQLLPVIDVWRESELPTGNEIGTMLYFAQSKLDAFLERDIEGLSARGANTITLRKLPDGRWTYRRALWSQQNEWSPEPSSLERLIMRI